MNMRRILTKCPYTNHINLSKDILFFTAVYLKAEITLPVDNIGQDGAATKERRQTAAYVTDY